MGTSRKESEANIQKLIAMGATREWIASQFGVGDTVSNEEFNILAPRWQQEKAGIDQRTADIESRAPDELKNNPSWASLPLDMKEVAVYNYEINAANNQNIANAWATALEKATAD